ncbi:hypothetical protein EV175_006220 [Coemansia sp. RSA 1933]|nr:hypothetical protein EV175_006220 [Coemansia sp. RSA 1933]
MQVRSFVSSSVVEAVPTVTDARDDKAATVEDVIDHSDVENGNELDVRDAPVLEDLDSSVRGTAGGNHGIQDHTEVS